MKILEGFMDELLKIAAHEGWGLGGEWGAYTGEPTMSQGPLLHEEGVPYDVQWKNDRRDHFHSMLMGVPSGKLVPGKLGDHPGKED